ncbi:glycosyltransferase family A protein [uncultured Algibacter sp.]|uniref:glycosyltransferase family 2 protein n=1 Tax=uncultured Algibacter sp. TaxID=298659 RepID=UPI003216E6A9
MEPFFSVIIPLYNKEDYIEETINSVLNQTYKDFEIIIVNDGSTDQSIKVIENNFQDYKFISVVEQENQGLSVTRNNGIKAAKGSLVALLDADDLWDSSFLQTIKELYDTFPSASVFGTDYIEKHTNEVILETKKSIASNLKNTSFLIKNFLRANMKQLLFCQSSVAYKREVFKQIKFNNKITFAEDVDFNILLHLKKYQVAYYYKPLSTIRLNIKNQLSEQAISKKTIPNFDTYEKYALNDLSLKKYLDIYRYFFAVNYKIEGHNYKYYSMLTNLNKENLNYKQKIYLSLPVSIIRVIKKIKRWFLKRNLRFTSF